MSKVAIRVRGLKKSFGKLQVLDGVSFSVKEGKILALLGPNGAGKTTTINIISTLMPQNAGSASIAGFDTKDEADRVRANIGLTGQFAAVDEYLTGRENIELIGKLYHLPVTEVAERADDLVRRLDLVNAADRPARTYSGGMKRRLDLAMSLVADPPVIFLDEPTTGLDPRSRLGLWGMIKDLAEQGRTILLTTQYMDEADFLADDVIVLDRGKIIAKGTPNQLKARAGADQVEVSFQKIKDLRRAIELFDEPAVDEENLSLRVPAKKKVESLRDVLHILEKAKIEPDTASIRRPTLDDVFLALTGHEATDQQKEQS